MSKEKVPLTEKEIKTKIKQSLGYSIKHGAYWGFMAGFGNTFLGAYAVSLQFTPILLSFIQSVPQAISAFFQLYAVRLTRLAPNRKIIVVIPSFLQAIIWFFVALYGFYAQGPYILIILITLYHILGTFAGAPWASWIGDLVHEDQRGRFFGKRNKIIGITTFSAVISGGLILDYTGTTSAINGFTILFSLATISRFISAIYLTKQYEPHVEIRPTKEYRFREFVVGLTKTVEGKFTIYMSLFFFATQLIGPFWVLYYLETLSFSYMEFTVITSIPVIIGFLTSTYWGRYADQFKNQSVLRYSTLLIALTVILWICTYFIPSAIRFYVTIPIQIIAGFAIAGFNLAASNFLYGCVSPKKRIRVFSYHNSMRVIAGFTASTLSGLFLWKINKGSVDSLTLPIIAVLAISVIFFLITSVLTKRLVIESKSKSETPQFFQFAAVLPMQGMIVESVIGLNRTKRSFRNRLRRIEETMTYWRRKKK